MNSEYRLPAIAGACVVVIGLALWFFFSGPLSLGVPTASAWDELKWDATTIEFADGLHCSPDGVTGPSTAEAQQKFRVLRARYTLSDDQNAQLDEIRSDAGGLSSSLAGSGGTPENCFAAKQLVDAAIAKMDAR